MSSRLRPTRLEHVVDGDRLRRMLDEQPDLADDLVHAVRRDLAARDR